MGQVWLVFDVMYCASVVVGGTVETIMEAWKHKQGPDHLKCRVGTVVASQPCPSYFVKSSEHYFLLSNNISFANKSVANALLTCVPCCSSFKILGNYRVENVLNDIRPQSWQEAA